MLDANAIEVPLERQFQSFQLTARDLRVAVETGAPVLPDVTELLDLAEFTTCARLRENIFSTIRSAVGVDCLACPRQSCRDEGCPLMRFSADMVRA